MQRVFMLALAISFITSTSFANTAPDSVLVDISRPAIVTVQISGGAGSQAEKLYNALTAISAQPDDAMGGRYGFDKNGPGIDCTVENDKFVQNQYTCLIKVDQKGNSLNPAS